ncbi:hypothetical protein B0H65DRAFT_453604 [Neurospora tetraspora]|uniref:Uncharacterized protein n=1 Tax=Neurospora tetraspora TaxID=94610 RepID=A0AAE0JQQ5_9PEZI|nr:hypothetical protein B0H65DRAFT_453604 [Neurospora tetraspora]
MAPLIRLTWCPNLPPVSVAAILPHFRSVTAAFVDLAISDNVGGRCARTNFIQPRARYKAKSCRSNCTLLPRPWRYSGWNFSFILRQRGPFGNDHHGLNFEAIHKWRHPCGC